MDGGTPASRLAPARAPLPYPYPYPLAPAAALAAAAAQAEALSLRRAWALVPRATDTTNIGVDPTRAAARATKCRRCPFPDTKKPGRSRALGVAWRRSLAYARPNTSVPLVPPKPKLLDITTSNFASRLCCTIGKPSAFGSSVSMLADPAMKPSRIISRL